MELVGGGARECGRRFVNQAAFRHHQVAKHQENPMCPSCNWQGPASMHYLLMNLVAHLYPELKNKTECRVMENLKKSEERGAKPRTGASGIFKTGVVNTKTTE